MLHGLCTVIPMLYTLDVKLYVRVQFLVSGLVMRVMTGRQVSPADVSVAVVGHLKLKRWLSYLAVPSQKLVVVVVPRL
jgi:hypothetical protein